MKINQIKEKNKSVILDNKEYKRTKQSFTDLYLYPNKEINNEEFEYVIKIKIIKLESIRFKKNIQLMK